MGDDRSRPVWLLDVDGVLNAGRPGWGAKPGQGDASFERMTFRMRWAPPLIARLAAYHRAGVAEIRWATTWVDEIAQIEALMGLPAFPTAFSGLPEGPQFKVPGLKADAALEVVEGEGRALIWTDDDAIPLSGPLLDRLNSAGPPILLVAPNPRRGLQAADLDRIDEFLAART
jgi:hypothetical protein